MKRQEKGKMLIIAIVLVCLAHFIRTLRWELFVKTYEKPNYSLCQLDILSIHLFHSRRVTWSEPGFQEEK